MGSMMARMMGFLGDRILVNGKPDFVLPMEARPYRLRLINGSNTRIYKLAWSDGSPSDGDRHRRRAAGKTTDTPLRHAGAGREGGVMGGFQRSVDRSRTHTAEPFLRRRYGDGRDDGWRDDGQHDGNHDGRSASGAPFPILKARVERRSSAKVALPRQLSTIEPPRPRDAVNFRAPRYSTSPWA